MLLPKPPPASLADVARAAGVSASTASRALNNNPAINSKTRQRVQEAAQALNYQRNQGARNLRLQRSHIISVVINHHGQPGQSLSDPFMMTLTSAIADALNEHGYGLLFASSTLTAAQWYDELVRNGRSDGIIVIGRGIDESHFERLQAEECPFVVWGQADANTPYPCIGSDNYSGGQQAARQLMLSGCTEPWFLGDIRHAEIRQRYEGFCAELARAHLPIHPPITVAGFTPEQGHQAILNALRQAPRRCDGLFASSDHLAIGAALALFQEHLKIPQDVALVGFDDIELAASSYPPLTTIHQDLKKGGRALVDTMLKRLAGQPTPSQSIPTRVVKRRTTRHLKNERMD